MKRINFRFLCRRLLRRPRKLLNFILLFIIVILVVSFILIFINEKPIRSSSTGTRKNITRSNDQNIYTNLRTKIPCPTKLRLLILVSSNLGHSDRRTLIRKTWGPDNSLLVRWRTVFLLTENNNQREKRRAEIESDLYGDIITGNYQESFFNMAFKVAMGFEWALKFCKFDYLLKADDDTFVNAHGLLEYLNLNSTLKEKLYTGNPMVGSPVLRKGRYAVKYAVQEKRDDGTNRTVFAPYCSGGGFLLSNDVVSALLNLYDLNHPLNIDDAYIGELALRAGVKPVINSRNFQMYADKCQYNPIAFVQHPAKGNCLEELYRKHVKYLLTGELETPKPTLPPTPPKPKPKPKLKPQRQQQKQEQKLPAKKPAPIPAKQVQKTKNSPKKLQNEMTMQKPQEVKPKEKVLEANAKLGSRKPQKQKLQKKASVQIPKVTDKPK